MSVKEITEMIIQIFLLSVVSFGGMFLYFWLSNKAK